MLHRDNKVYCSSPSQVPNIDHYAIITGTSVYIPGDQRSKDYPGHGYPESTNNYIQYLAYFDKDEWEAAISKLSIPPAYGEREEFKAIIVKVPVIQVITKFSIT